MSRSPIVTIVPAASLDPLTRAQLIALVNEAFLRHDWLFPGVQRTDDEDFAEETAGADLILVDDSTASADSPSPESGAPVPAEPAAMGLIRPDELRDDALYLGMVAVRPALQGRGLGAAIVRVAEDEARRRGLIRVALTTIPELGNTAYYERKGYAVVSSTPRPAGHWGSTAPYALVRMERDLR